MPSTITNFHSFTPGTKARSSEVNTNFSNFRGTILPIEANTAAASHNTHDLGASDHRWSSVYAGTVDLLGATTTSNLVLKNITAVTAGAAEMLTGSQTLASFNYGSFGFGGYTTSAFTKFQYQAAGVGNILELLSGGTTLAVFDTSGISPRSIGPMEWTTASAPNGYALLTAVTTTDFKCNTTASVTICTARITVSSPGVVAFGFAEQQMYGYITGGSGQFVAAALYRGYRGTTTTAMTLLSSAQVSFYGEGHTVGGFRMAYFFDDSFTAGELVYEIRFTGITANTLSANSHVINRGRFFIKQL